MFKNINAGLIASRASFLTDRNRLLYTRLITNSSGDQFYSRETGYVYHIFTQPGSFDVHTRGSVDIMLVGGGGGGGGTSGTNDSSFPHGSGGGGAGGLQHHYNKVMPVGTYDVYVGNGGAAGLNGGAPPIDSTSFVADTPFVGRGSRGGLTQIHHKNSESYPGGTLPSNTPPANWYELEDGTLTLNGPTFFSEWGTRIRPNNQITNDVYYDDLTLRIIPTSPDESQTYAITAFGGGGGGYTAASPTYGVPTPIVASIPRAYYGGGGGSAGGGGNRFDPNPAIGVEYNCNPDGSRELDLGYSPPEGNLGGGIHRPRTPGYNAPAIRNGGGGGGGAGGAGSSGTSNGPGGEGGIGVAAFGGDTGIPTDYGTPGPTPGRWFAGGGGGGNNSWPGLPNAIDGRYGGGGISVTNPYPSFPGLSRNAVANTGGGGAGAHSYTPYVTPYIESAGSGGSGIVIIRYQAAH